MALDFIGDKARARLNAGGKMNHMKDAVILVALLSGGISWASEDPLCSCQWPPEHYYHAAFWMADYVVEGVVSAPIDGSPVTTNEQHVNVEIERAWKMRDFIGPELSVTTGIYRCLHNQLKPGVRYLIFSDRDESLLDGTKVVMPVCWPTQESSAVPAALWKSLGPPLFDRRPPPPTRDGFAQWGALAALVSLAVSVLALVVALRRPTSGHREVNKTAPSQGNGADE